MINKKYNALIVDDEKKIRTLLQELIATSCPDLYVIGVADSVQSAYDILLKQSPDLVFLDIKMSDGTGFDLLKKLPKIDFSIIFVTAFDEYALKAIKFNALDYIVKPVHSDDLMTAVDRFRQTQQPSPGFQQLLDNIALPRKRQKMAITSVSKIEYVPLDQVIHLEADGSYCIIHLDSKKKILSTRSIKHYESILLDEGFFRVNRSHMINLEHVREYIKSEMDKVRLSNGEVVEFSRKRRNAFTEAMDANHKMAH
jgi:two-component system LytT family response regulator